MPKTGTNQTGGRPSITIGPDTPTERIVSLASMALADAGMADEAALYAEAVRRACGEDGSGERENVIDAVARWIDIRREEEARP